MKKILLYGVDDQTADRYQNLASDENVAMYVINDSFLNETVETAFSINSDLDNVHEQYDRMYMLMMGISEDELIRLITSFVQHGLPFDGVKVMLSENGPNWTLRHLFEETGMENDRTVIMIELRKLLLQAESIQINLMPELEAKRLKKAIQNGKAVASNKNIEYFKLHECITELKDAMESAPHILS